MRRALRRELDLVLGARPAWAMLAISALVTGHSLVLAVDLFSASSRSAGAGALMAAQMDPLAGIVRPTLGGMQLAASLFVPLITARGLAVEKERGSWVRLAATRGGTAAALAPKLVAAAIGGLAMMLAPATCLVAYVIAGGTVDAIETSVALVGHALHLVTLSLVCVLAAAISSSLAQAAAIGIGVALGSWVVEVATDFAALSWLAPLEALTIDAPLRSFDAGIVRPSSILYFTVLALGTVVAAFAAARFDRRTLRIARIGGVLVVTAGVLAATTLVRGGWDWSEQRRSSLPPRTADALRSLPGPLSIDVWLDRDDARRTLVDRGALARLSLARPDLVVRYPLDERDASPLHDDDYGQLVVHVGDRSRVTRTTAPRELTTILFELADTPVPDYVQPRYAGHPAVIEGGARTALALFAYLFLPGLFALFGLARERRSMEVRS
jgi:hypothetical protein